MNKINFDQQRLPEIFRRNEQECYLDPIRQKLIYVTPEETIRQKVISFLLDQLKVPQQYIRVEEHLSHYGIQSKRRADIIIEADTRDGEQTVPIAVIECKAPNVYLDEKAMDQALDYSDMLGAEYVLLVNGYDQMCYVYDQTAQKYREIENLPDYQDMVAGKYQTVETGELPERIPFNQLENFLVQEFESYDDPHDSVDISKLTPMELAVPVFNLWEGLLDTRIKMPAGDYGLFRLIEDYGVRMITYGNASGGKFYGPYRSFLVDVDGSAEFYSIGVSTYCTMGKPDYVRTCICVAHDDEKESHHALQMGVEDNVSVNGNTVKFYHHGRIAVGKMGSGKVDELREFVRVRYPAIISGKRFFLGSIKNDRLWRLDDPEVMDLVVNLISYAMIRDEYRDFVKNKE